jgi:hypothetical protein
MQPGRAWSERLKDRASEPDDCASVSPSVRRVSAIVRRPRPPVSAIVRQKQAMSGRQAAHHCASLQLGFRCMALANGVLTTAEAFDVDRFHRRGRNGSDDTYTRNFIFLPKTEPLVTA